MTSPLPWIRNNGLGILIAIKWGLAAFALILLINIQVSTARQAVVNTKNGQQIKKLSEDNKRLEQENKQLGEQNAQLSKQNQQYLGCNFLAFAHFTQTYQPIQDSEINSCNVAPVAATQSSAKKQSTTTATPAQNTAPAASTQSTPTPATPEQTSQQSFLSRTARQIVALPGNLIRGVSGLL